MPNIRVIVFAVVALALIGFPAYIFLEEKITGGVQQVGDLYKVNLKTMSSFEFDQANGTLEDVPARWRELDGKRVQLEGEMWAPNAAGSEVPEFELVFSIAKCCFTGAPQIQHFVLARHKTEGKPMPFYSGLVRVTGTLRVNVERSEGKVTRIYSLIVEDVRPV